MKKKSFWARANHGFLISMALIVLVLLGVLVTQLLLIPEKNDVKALGKAVNDLWQTSTIMEDARAAELHASPAKQAEEKQKIKAELDKYFGKDKSYLDNATDKLFGNMRVEYETQQRTRTREPVRNKTLRCLITEDTATLQMQYFYKVSGSFFDFNGGGIYTECEDQTQMLLLELTLRKTDGKWGIYRVGNLSTNIAEEGKR